MEGGKSRVRGLGVPRPWGQTVVGWRTQESIRGPDRPYPQTGWARCSEHKRVEADTLLPWSFGDPVPSPPPGLPRAPQAESLRLPLVASERQRPRQLSSHPAQAPPLRGRAQRGTPKELPFGGPKDSQPPTRRPAFRFSSRVKVSDLGEAPGNSFRTPSFSLDFRSFNTALIIIVLSEPGHTPL